MNKKQTLTPYPYSVMETKGINGTTSDPNEAWDRLEEEYRDPGTDVQKSDVELTDDLKNESTRIMYTHAELLKLYKEPTAKCPHILASLYGSAARCSASSAVFPTIVSTSGDFSSKCH